MSEKSSEKCLACEMMMNCLDRVLKGNDDGGCAYFAALKASVTAGKGKNNGTV